MSPRILIERAVAALLMILLSPLLLAMALAVRVTMGKPVIFSQIRSGLGQRTYRLVKFRTMTDACDPSGELLPDECRTPRAGALLRRTRMDELPQLWNIVRGEMSFIGPRPLLPPTIASMGQDGVCRCSVRPGLTGWAQIHGGPLLSLSEKLDLDLWYIRSANLRLDAIILWRTFLVVLMGDRWSHDPVAILSKRRPLAQVVGGDGGANDDARAQQPEPVGREASAGQR